MIVTLDFDTLVSDLLARYRITIHRWRRSMSGCAWAAWYADGSVVQYVESPYPKSMLSLAILLHEIGHHQVGFDTHKRRCEEELAAWDWAIAELRRLGIEPDARVMRRYTRSMEYAVQKAQRRGLQIVPEALRAYAA